ncbi:MAG: COX15/CtaA family protein [candidate division Zixibacteria bacterium]|nr:COX15/CtaA family protein [candidate division Zixibacteria bacterium]
MMRNHRTLIIWLSIVLVTIAAMVTVGGVTRLTHSGLSMVEWKPLLGTLPPITHDDWSEKFDMYKRFPEYQKLNSSMTLSEFKSIFWWEYTHRLLGRLIGVIFLVPWLYFWIKKKVPAGYNRKFAFLFVLGGLQGLLGWYLVTSGLVDNPFVSHYRLAAHLALAFFLFGATLWIILLLRGVEQTRLQAPGLKALSWLALGLISLQIIYGAFTAGLKAGFVLNTFPLMNGQLIPTDLIFNGPFWRSAVEDVFTVQFIHRALGWLVVLGILSLWFYARRFRLTTDQRLGIHCLAIAVVLQFILGVLTLIYAVPLTLAAAHQAGALALFGSSVLTAFLFTGKKIS